ncbi:helix-turn-helix domain-containing protein [Streptomyces sp. NPDC087866]|uniref:helix-turn-helix domain-containing protein n=1 Tax=unclassified Streptomyces TaxID=2593676 RepID=UPI0033B2B346
MLTLAALARRSEYALHPPADHDRTGDDTVVVDRAALLTRADWPGDAFAGTLLVCEPDSIGPDRAATVLRRLADQRAAGLVVADAEGRALPPGLVAAARRAALPVLRSTEPVAVWRHTLIPRVTEQRLLSADRHAVRLGRLLDHLAPGPRPAPAELIAWLSGELGADIRLDDARARHAPAPVPAGDAALSHPVAVTGQILTARRSLPWSASESELLRRTAAVLAPPPPPPPSPLVPAGEGRAAQLATSLRAARLAAFQALMTGHIEPAQRILGPLAPGLLDTDDAQIAIIDCASGPRDEVFARVESRLDDDGNGLAVRCPAFEGHIIVVAPRPDPDAHEAPALARLRSLVADNGLLTLGISPVMPVEDIGSGYSMAYDAIATARISPTRAATATGTPGLLEALHPGTAQQWATALLSPVLGRRGCDQHMSTVGLGLEFEVSAASRILGIHRNTLSRRVRGMLQVTGLDPDRTLDRIALSLALQIHALHGPAPRPAAGAVPRLAGLLAQEPVTTWASTALAPLRQDHTDRRTTGGETLLRTLRAWAALDFRVDAAAQQTGLYPATVRSHIRAAEGQLDWMLLSALPTGHLATDEDAPRKQSGLRNLAVALQTTPGSPPLRLPDPVHAAADPSRP